MASAKFKTVEANVPPASLFTALVYTLQQEDKYTIGALSNERKEVILVRAKTAFSWGHLVAGTVVEHEGKSELRLAAQNVDGAPWSLMDGKKNQKVLDDLAAELNAVLSTSPPPTPVHVESFQVMDDGSTIPWTEGEYIGH